MYIFIYIHNYTLPKSDSFNPFFVRPNKPRHCQRSTWKCRNDKSGEHPIDVPAQPHQTAHPCYQGPLVHLVDGLGHRHGILEDQADAPLGVRVEVGEARLELDGPTRFWATSGFPTVPEGFQESGQLVRCSWRWVEKTTTWWRAWTSFCLIELIKSIGY